MSELNFEEIEVEGSGEGSKYRATVLKFLDSGLERAVIRCEFIAKAESVDSGLKHWICVDDPVRVFRRGRMVYLERTV